MAARHREAVDLFARHDLSAEELAGVLGISSQQATELVAQARDDLDTSVAASIIARTGRGDCPSVAALVTEGEWPLPTEVCRKLIRHIESCPVCRDRRKRKVSTNRLMQVLPIATIPSDLRMAVLSLSEAPDQHDTRLRIAQRAEPFDVWGWPTSLERRAQAARGKSRRGGGALLWPALGAAACVLLLIGAIFLVTGRGPDGSNAANNKVPDGVAAAPADSASDFLSPSDSVEPSPTKTKHSPSPSPTPTTHTPTPTPTPTPTTHRPTPRSHPSHKPPTRKPPKVGTLSVSDCDMALTGKCPITLTASGGTVHWSVASSDGIVLSPKTGTVTPGHPVDVSASLPSDVCPEKNTATVVFSPSGSATVHWDCPVTGR
jgi:hypothetical protein